MVIEKQKVVLVHYTLTEGNAEGEKIESTEGREPLGFIYGVGQMIPDFESNLKGLKTGDTFAFGIKAADAYGEYDEKALVELPIEAFLMEGGKVPDGILEVGNVIPLQDQEGNQFQGKVVKAGLEKVQIDLNHPMAGVDLFFTGHVELVRDADAAELEHGHVHGPGGHHH